MLDIADFSINDKLVNILALKASPMFTLRNKFSSFPSSMPQLHKKIISLLLAIGISGLSGLTTQAWSKPAQTTKATATKKTAVSQAPADKKKTNKKDDAGKSSAQRKAAETTSQIAKNKTKLKTAKSRDSDADIRRPQRTQKNLANATQKNTRPLTKAQKLAAEKQAKLAAAEQARQERLEAAQALRLDAAKRERQEISRQQQLVRQKQLAAETDTVPLVKKTAAQEEDLIALQLAKSEAASALSAASPSPAATASTAPVSEAQPQVNPEPTGVASGTISVKESTVVAQSSPAVTPAPAATISEPVTTAASVPAERKTANPAIIRTSAPAREAYRPSQRLNVIQPGSAPELYSNVAFVMDQNTGQVLLNKNGHLTAPIASITKLMTAVITMDANLPMDELITITSEDVDRVKRSSSRLAVGSTLSRQELLHLALMSSENRAAHALGRTYPGGLTEAVRAMNMRALMLGMRDTRYVEPTGLSSANQSSAHDLAQLVKAAYHYPLIRNYTTYPGSRFPVLGQMTNYNNTNRLVYSDNWNIGLQKTGYISEAGRCVVMQSHIGGRNIIIVLLDSNNSNRRAEDAEAIRYWVQNGISPSPAPNDAKIVAQLSALH